MVQMPTPPFQPCCAPQAREFHIEEFCCGNVKTKKVSQFISNICESLLDSIAQRYYDNVVALRYLLIMFNGYIDTFLTENRR